MKLVVAGSSGLVGRALVKKAAEQGHEVVRLVRRFGVMDSEAAWEPAAELLDPSVLEGAQLVVNLCGAGIAEQRWTPERKLELWNSRLHSTRTLVKALDRVRQRPEVFISASAVGYYGERGEELLLEDAAPGEGFLSDLCQAWECEALQAEDFGVRTICLRLGLVLAAEGGILGRMLPIFRNGLGGMLGDGQAWMSWIGMQDLLRLILAAPEMPSLKGPVNAVAPGTLRNQDFSRALGRALKRPCFFHVPAALLKLRYGEMAEQALLASTRASPGALSLQGFSFQQPMIEGALKHALAGPGKFSAVSREVGV